MDALFVRSTRGILFFCIRFVSFSSFFFHLQLFLSRFFCIRFELNPSSVDHFFPYPVLCDLEPLHFDNLLGYATAGRDSEYHTGNIYSCLLLRVVDFGHRELGSRWNKSNGLRVNIAVYTLSCAAHCWHSHILASSEESHLTRSTLCFSVADVQRIGSPFSVCLLHPFISPNFLSGTVRHSPCTVSFNTEPILRNSWNVDGQTICISCPPGPWKHFAYFPFFYFQFWSPLSSNSRKDHDDRSTNIFFFFLFQKPEPELNFRII